LELGKKLVKKTPKWSAEEEEVNKVRVKSASKVLNYLYRGGNSGGGEILTIRKRGVKG